MQQDARTRQARAGCCHGALVTGALASERGAPVQHGAQDFGGHDQAVGVLLDLHISSEQPHIELGAHVSELLVADGLDRSSVHSLGLVQLRKRKRVLCQHSFACTCLPLRFTW